MTTRPVLVISGASGLIGTHLIEAAKARYDLRLLTRNPDKAAENREGLAWIVWNPEAASRGDKGALRALTGAVSGAHAIVNLAGVSVAEGRLDEAHRQKVIESRTRSARALLLAQGRAAEPARVWFQASATGFYGDRGDAVLTEASPAGRGPLVDICRVWEAAPEDAGGARLVIGRIGIVLAEDAPGWRKMVLPVKFFVGGPFGSGQQWYSWIDADDLARAILFLVEKEGAAGVYNLTTPDPIRQGDLVRQTAARLGRPALLAAPAFALRLALGGLADALILASARVLPERLQEEGFVFECPNFGQELDNLL